MGWKSKIILPYAKWVRKGVIKMASNAIQDQNALLFDLIKTAKDTAFGQEHSFSSIRSYSDFKRAVPIRDYEGLRKYVDLIIEGKQDILWPGLPKYFAKTSGTTSGVKYIPLTKASIPNHIFTAQKAAMNFIALNPEVNPFDGKIIFLSGSPEVAMHGGIKTGRLSGIVNHEVPSWIRSNQMPSYETNCIDSWEEKVDRIVEETLKEDMRMISGIPPWVQMYYEQLLEVTGKQTIKEVFPNFNLFIYGGVNYEPYRPAIEQLIGARVPSIELFPASEGFFAFQDQLTNEGLLLNTNSGIFYEFIPLSEVFNENPERIQLSDIEIGVDYALIINNNAGLWGYNIGDTVRFVSKDPYRLVVSGRIKHYISAFGEHVIGKEVEQAMEIASQQMGVRVVEFTVAPQVNPTEGLPYHEWFVEFDQIPHDIEKFKSLLDHEMVKQNIYYKDLIDGKILQPLKINSLEADTFRKYMKENGKLGGQNKVPRLTNDRKLADSLQKYSIGLD